jgi:hypothetical protein
MLRGLSLSLGQGGYKVFLEADGIATGKDGAPATMFDEQHGDLFEDARVPAQENLQAAEAGKLVAQVLGLSK